MATKTKAPVRKARVIKVASGSAIEGELLKATGVDQQGDDEDRQDFLKRLAAGVDQNVSEDDYGNLSEEAQEWYTKAYAAASKRKTIPEFADVAAEDEGDAGEQEEAEEKPARGRPKGKAKATTKGKAKSNGITHRSGSVREKAHKLFDEMTAKGKDRAAILAAFAKLGWSEGTCKTQYQVFKNL